MATRRFSINPENSEFQVTEAAGIAVVTKNIELTVNLAAVLGEGSGTRAINRGEVLLALEKLYNYVEKISWPPA